MSTPDNPKLDSFLLDDLTGRIDTLIHAMDVAVGLLIEVDTKSPDRVRKEVDQVIAVVECAMVRAKATLGVAEEAVVPFRRLVVGAKHEAS